MKIIFNAFITVSYTSNFLKKYFQILIFREKIVGKVHSGPASRFSLSWRGAKAGGKARDAAAPLQEEGRRRSMAETSPPPPAAEPAASKQNGKSIADIAEDVQRTVLESRDSAIQTARSLHQNSSTHLRSLQVPSFLFIHLLRLFHFGARNRSPDLGPAISYIFLKFLAARS